MRVTNEQLGACAARVAQDLVTEGPCRFPAVVGLLEIGRMFGLARSTPYQWRSTGVLPEQDGSISNNPVWKPITIYRFAEDTRRTIIWDPWGLHVPHDEAGLDAADREDHIGL